MRQRTARSAARLLLWTGLAMADAAAGAGDTDTFLRDYAETRGWSLGRPVKVQFTPDGQAALFLRAQPRKAQLGLFEFDVASGRTRELLTPAQLLGGGEEWLSPAEKARRERMRVTAGGFTDFQISKDGARLLLSLGGRLFVLDRATGDVTALQTGEGALVDPKFSPDGRFVGYVLDHDVRVYDLVKGRERAVTTGGTEEVSHGLAEFVAQEEMGRFSGWWWSPDAKAIAYTQADARGVEKWHIPDPFQPGTPPHAQFYPRPGKANVKVRLGVGSARGGRTRWVAWDAARYPYLARVDWHERGGLTLVVQTRDQTELALLRADPKTGATQTLLTERDPAWVNLDQAVPRWLNDGGGFLWTSERAGNWQLELRAAGGSLRRMLVPPDAGYRDLVSVDEAAGVVYFRASTDPTQAHLHRVPLDGGEVVSLTGEVRGQHNAAFAPNHAAYTHTLSTLDHLPKTVIRRADHQVVAELPSVAEPPPFLPRVELATVGEAGLHAKLIRPRAFEAGRKYPVLVHVYGGPGAQMVQAGVNGQFLDQWLADQGFIVVALDGRGTPGRGRDWERAIQRKFGEVPLADQAAGLRALGGRFPELDLGRVGIYGWSFGGYMAAQAVLRRPDVFHAAVAVASVTDWLDYDTHYTERYLGVPATEADPVYCVNSLLADAPNLRRPLLLVHGTADDNVFFRHTLKLADALFRAGRTFELLPLAGFTHMVPEAEATERLWRRTASFFQQRLNAKPAADAVANPSCQPSEPKAP
jgi:dipeptidyl-peptidase-4